MKSSINTAICSFINFKRRRDADKICYIDITRDTKLRIMSGERTAYIAIDCFEPRQSEPTWYRDGRHEEFIPPKYSESFKNTDYQKVTVPREALIRALQCMDSYGVTFSCADDAPLWFEGSFELSKDGTRDSVFGCVAPLINMDDYEED